MYGFKIIFGAKMTGMCIPTSSPKDKTLDKNYEDKRSRPGINITVACSLSNHLILPLLHVTKNRWLW